MLASLSAPELFVKKSRADRSGLMTIRELLRLGCGLAAPELYAPNMGALVPASAESTSSDVRSTVRPSGGS